MRKFKEPVNCLCTRPSHGPHGTARARAWRDPCRPTWSTEPRQCRVGHRTAPHRARPTPRRRASLRRGVPRVGVRILARSADTTALRVAHAPQAMYPIGHSDITEQRPQVGRRHTLLHTPHNAHTQVAPLNMKSPVLELAWPATSSQQCSSCSFAPLACTWALLMHHTRGRPSRTRGARATRLPAPSGGSGSPRASWTARRSSFAARPAPCAALRSLRSGPSPASVRGGH